ncbi:hypothetical protein FNV43_RR24124 [Rhamnella rubrinervis]|uniref:Uncharacterized protein n=1 Tax=Rhamnella rubrinervis TaxID=2594499 RepID=A0A8K0DKX2_9ROSA|nr:hypothetical protein FNV43_RR24124 [Rhamnella rubrinervis]
MAGIKSVVHQTSKAAVLVLVIALMVQSQSSRGQSQSCSSELSSLNVCSQFVVPALFESLPNFPLAAISLLLLVVQFDESTGFDVHGTALISK